MPQSRKVKKIRLKGEQRRQAIIDAAHDLFISKGYRAVSLDEIVQKAGGSKSAVYQYFGNKEGLLTAVTESLAAKMLAEMELPTTEGNDIRECLNLVGRRLIKLALSQSAIWQFRLAICNLTVDPALSQRWYRHGPETTFHGFARYLEKEVKNGRLRIQNCQRAADFFLGMLICKGNFTMLIGEPAPSPQAMRKIVSEAVDVFLAAYGV